MTPDREAEIRRAVDRAAIDLLTEIDRLRALPVLRTCGECGWCSEKLDAQRTWCSNPRAPFALDLVARAVEQDAPPPAWCPLRGGR